MASLDQKQEAADNLEVLSKSMSESSNPFFLHPGDAPGQLLVSEKLNSDVFFETWKTSMLIALSAKNKFGFIDGSLPPPAVDDVSFPLWKRCNDMVQGWLLTALHPSIAKSVLHSNTAKEIWDELSQRYGQANKARVFQIQKDLANISQDNNDISTYFSRVNAVWDELRSIHDIPKCTCGGCHCKVHINSRLDFFLEESKLIQFLMGLDESYISVRGTILMMSPLPSLAQVYSILAQEEQQRNMRVFPISSSLSVDANKSLRKPIIERKGQFVCTNCKKTGHTVDKCFHLHGFPKNWVSNNNKGKQKAPLRKANLVQYKQTERRSQFVRNLNAEGPDTNMAGISSVLSSTNTCIKVKGIIERVTKHVDVKTDDQSRTLTLHTFSDLSSVSPVVFLYLLKECYFCGKSKATTKFRTFQQQVSVVLKNAPQPGPAVFIVRCLYVIPLFKSHADEFSHLVVSSLRKFLKGYTNASDFQQGQDAAAQLFLDIVQGYVVHGESLLKNILEAFDLKLVNVENAMLISEPGSFSKEKAEAFVDNYILRHIKSQSYMTAVSLLEQFSIRHSGEPFLYKMLEEKNFRAAEKWASCMGRSMLCILVEEYVKMNMLKGAYRIIKRNNLISEFPDVYHKCTESALKTLAEKGCWDVAEESAKNDRQLLEFLVYLAMEAGYLEKADELCGRYSLEEGFVKAKDFNEAENHPLQIRYLNLDELSIDDIIWVYNVDALQAATSYIEGCKVVGVDSEWKPNYVKGSKRNKVSIIQIASEKVAFIIDLIKLHDDAPEILDSCFTRILHSPRVLKLGYDFQSDMHQLSSSYPNLACFKRCDMLLDIQKVFNDSCGGLSGLVKKILGTALNKTRSSSNWEQRPLTPQQLEYAALDAVVLVHLFHHIENYSNPGVSSQDRDGDGDSKMEWKSYIVSHIVNTRPKKTIKINKYTRPKRRSYPKAEQHPGSRKGKVSHIDNTRPKKKSYPKTEQQPGSR